MTDEPNTRLFSCFRFLIHRFESVLIHESHFTFTRINAQLNGILIGYAVLAGLTVVINRHILTDTQTDLAMCDIS